MHSTVSDSFQFHRFLCRTVLLCGVFVGSVYQSLAVDNGALNGVRHRVMVSTDIGGTDPDDIQSMVHLLVYADCFDLEGLVSSPYGPGRKKHILEAIDAYEKDLPNLKTYSEEYPSPDALRAITKQGATETPGESGVATSTEGSDWIISCAKRADERPLHVLVWGGIEDVAQALHDAPEILPKLRVYYIGGPNKKWSPDAFQYVATHHPTLWMIEANSTYRGWFVGGDQNDEWGNESFVETHVAGHGALGKHFIDAKADLKMGDTPSIARLLRGVSDEPSKPSWGGKYVRAWERPYSQFAHLPERADQMEVFGILELNLPIGDDVPDHPEAHLVVENQKLAGSLVEKNTTLRFRFCPKAAKSYTFTIRSNVPALNDRSGGITAITPAPEVASQESARFPNWWTDDMSPALAEGSHSGAKTVNRWRKDFLKDFAERMDRCTTKATGDQSEPVP